MSGIAGILNLDGAPVDPNLLRHMAEATAYQGSHSIGKWTGIDKVGMAHLAFNVAPGSPHDCQPRSSSDGSLWISADARVDNRDELVRTLTPKQISLGNLSDAELILAAYTAWGISCPQHIVGDFAFAIWDDREQRLFCARDRMGTRSLYYHFTPAQCFLWASECKQLLRHPRVSRKLNERMIGAHLLPCPGQPDWSFFADIAQLPPAHALFVDSSGLHIERYWEIDPENEIRYRHDAEYEEHFRSLFKEIMLCHLRSTGPVAILLSGGLDSGTIASVAGHLIRNGDAPGYPPPLWSLNWAFKELTECDERTYSDHIVRTYDLTPEYILGDSHWLLSDYDDPWPIPDDPTMLTCPPLLRATLIRARELGMTTVMTGSGGNALVGGCRPNYVDRILRLQWQALWRDARHHHRIASMPWSRFIWSYLIQPALPMQLQRNIFHHKPETRSNWITSDFAKRVDLREIEQASLPQKRLRDLANLRRFQAVTNEHETRIMVAQSRLARGQAIDYRLPWRDVRLFEFVMAIPSDQVWRGGEPKHIVRRAMQGIVPEIVRTNRTVGSIQPLRTIGFRDKGRPTVEFLLRQPLMAEYGFVDATVLQKEYQSYCHGLRSEYPLNYAINLEIWLRRLFEDDR